MDAESQRFRRITMKVLTMQLNSTSVMDIIAYGGAAIGMGVAVSEFLKVNISMAGTLCIVLLASEFFLPLRLLGSFFHIAMNGMAASDKIFKILDLPEPQVGEKTLPEGALDIRLDDVHFSYEAGREILKGVKLDLQAGSFVSLVGESGCGKSTIGVVLAKVLGFDFVDADVLIQKKHGKLLRELIAEYGDDGFLQIENDVNKEIDLKNTVIATGGSVVYCDEAMQHYVKNDIVVYIELPYEVIASRLENVKRRGVVLKDGQTLKDLYKERILLYEKYAQITVKAEGLSVEELMDTIAEKVLAYESTH